MLQPDWLGECILDTVIRLESRCVGTLRNTHNLNLRPVAHLVALDILSADLSETSVVLYQAT
jgi:hypothetical protein